MLGCMPKGCSQNNWKLCFMSLNISGVRKCKYLGRYKNQSESYLYLLTFLNCVGLVMPPTLKKWGHIGFGLSVCMYVCMYSCSRYRLETSSMDSSWKNNRRIFLVFPELSPLVKLRPFDKQGDEIL